MLGFCYNELQQYDRAYYYLTFVTGVNRTLYAEEYVNCMIYLGDYRSLMTIDGILEDLHNSIVEDEEGEVEQSVHPFLQFLYRRKAYVLVELRRFDEAEEMLRQMIDDPESGDFALDELAYIQQLRENDKLAEQTNRIVKENIDDLCSLGILSSLRCCHHYGDGTRIDG